MSIVDLATAKSELRVTHDAEDVDITRKVAAAQEQAEVFLNRRVFEDQYEMDAEIDAVPTVLAAASTAYDLAMEAAALLDGTVVQQAAERYAEDRYRDAQHDAQMVYRGMVVNESIRTAVLLITASLWEHRGDEEAVEGVPKAARTMLWPWRVGIGV